MTTVVTENCKDCRFTDCVTVCPVEAFHQGDDMLYINPDVCIDCSACIPECPVEAIFEEDDLLFGWQFSCVAVSHKSSLLSFDSFDKHTE